MKFEMAPTQKPRSTNLKIERVQLQPENPNPVEEKDHATPQKKSKARKKRPRFYTATRRSKRIRNNATPSQNQNLQPVQFTLGESETESEREEEPPQLEANVEEPPQLEENMEEPAVRGEKTLVEKVDYAVELLLSMSPQGTNWTSDSSENIYRSLYINSQKQNEALKKENSELSLKLQVALAKIEGIDKGSNASVEWMAKFKDVLLITSLSKASEMAAAVQCQDPTDPKAASSSKKKR